MLLKAYMDLLRAESTKKAISAAVVMGLADGYVVSAGFTDLFPLQE
jgi:hypothetical protein